MKAKLGAGLTAVILLVLMVAPASAQQGPIGMVIDGQTDTAVVFDAGTDTVLGTVPVDPSHFFGDCSITQDQTLGFVAAYNGLVWVIDLTTSPPSLAGGTNPILLSNTGEDTTITPDQRFLLVADGSNPQPLSIIDIGSRTEINTFSLGNDHNSVEVLSDGSVLVASLATDMVYRLTIDGGGNLTDTGDALATGGDGAINVFGGHGAMAGLLLNYSLGEC
jgi:hypothetical protein